MLKVLKWLTSGSSLFRYYNSWIETSTELAETEDSSSYTPTTQTSNAKHMPTSSFGDGLVQGFDANLPKEVMASLQIVKDCQLDEGKINNFLGIGSP